MFTFTLHIRILTTAGLVLAALFFAQGAVFAADPVPSVPTTPPPSDTPPLALPVPTLTAAPTSIASGQSSTLAWSSTNATACLGTGFATGGTTQGSTSVAPTETTTYVLACTGDSGTATTSATVTVTTATPTPVTIFSDGFETALNWTRAGNTTWYTGTPKTGTHSVRLIQTGYIQKPIPLTGYQDVSVSFRMGANSLDTASEYVEALYYNGSAWVSLARIENGSANENNLLNPYAFTLPTSVNNLSTFALRFKITGDKKDYGYVDDVKVIAAPMQ